MCRGDHARPVPSRACTTSTPATVNWSRTRTIDRLAAADQRRQSSHINLADPLFLDFEYMRWMAELIEAHWPTTEAGCAPCIWAQARVSMARYLAATYPEARQVAVDLDKRLTELVRGWFNLPHAPLLRLRAGDAREVTESLTDATRDLIIRDVFSGVVTPTALTTRVRPRVRRVLAPGGIYVVNSGDAPALTLARAEAATIGTIFEHMVIIADPAMLKGRRYGNMIIAGSDTVRPLRADPRAPRRRCARAHLGRRQGPGLRRRGGRTA